jgi:PAS domain S-box-containing protein
MNDLLYDMPIDVPALKTEGTVDGLDFVNVLRDCLSCAVISLNERREVIAFNPIAEHLTGLPAARVLGQSPEFLPAPLQHIIREIFANDRPISDRRVTLPDKRRGEITVQVTATSTRNESGLVSGVVLVLNNISSVKQWEANMRRLDRLHSVGTLSASMAHEIRNAFVAVRTFVDLLLEKDREAELAGIVRREMTRIDSLVSQMLRLSGPARPEFSSVPLHFILNKSLLLIQHLLSDKKIRVTRSLNAASDLINGDQDQLQQAFLNLFLNALDAMPNGGEMSIVTELLPASTTIEGIPATQKRLLRLTIRDNGTGISQENMERMFEPFFTTKPDGTGLGLAITRRILQEHQGAISVQSEPGKGTEFLLTLPAS